MAAKKKTATKNMKTLTQMTQEERMKLPPNKRWPGRFSAKMSFWTPKGSRIDFETAFPEEMGHRLLMEVSKHMGRDDG